MAVTAPAAPAALSARGIVKSFGGRRDPRRPRPRAPARARDRPDRRERLAASRRCCGCSPAPTTPDAGTVTLRRGAVVAHLSAARHRRRAHGAPDDPRRRPGRRGARGRARARRGAARRPRARRRPRPHDRASSSATRACSSSRRRSAPTPRGRRDPPPARPRHVGPRPRPPDARAQRRPAQARRARGVPRARRPDVLLLDEPEAHLDVERRRDRRGARPRLRGRRPRRLPRPLPARRDRLADRRARARPDPHVAGQLLARTPSRARSSSIRQQQQCVTQQKEIARLEEAIRRFKDWAHRVVDERHIKRARNAQRRIDRMEKVERPVFERRKMALALRSAARGGDRVIELRGVDFDPVLIDVTLTIMRGERVGIVGPNGAGKTVLARLLARRPRADRGRALGGPEHRVRLPHPDGRGAAGRPDADRDRPRAAKPIGEGEAVAAAREVPVRLRAAAPADRVDERRRAHAPALPAADARRGRTASCSTSRRTTSTSRRSRRSRRALERYDGTVIAVSHDRYFLDRIADRIVEVRDGDVRAYEGGFSAWSGPARVGPAPLKKPHRRPITPEDVDPGGAKTGEGPARGDGRELRGRDRARRLRVRAAGPAGTAWWDKSYNAAEFFAAAACAVRAARTTGPERAAWIAFTRRPRRLLRRRHLLHGRARRRWPRRRIPSPSDAGLPAHLPRLVRRPRPAAARPRRPDVARAVARRPHLRARRAPRVGAALVFGVVASTEGSFATVATNLALPARRPRAARVRRSP